MILIASLSVTCCVLNLSQLNQSITSHILICKDLMMDLAKVFDESMLTIVLARWRRIQSAVSVSLAVITLRGYSLHCSCY